MTPVRWVVLVGAGLIGVATATVSSISLYSLAARCAIPEPWSAALPVALDAAAAVGALAWVAETGRARAWGRGMAVVALLGALAGNGVEHALAAGLVEVGIGLVLAVGAAIPASLWASVHLSALLLTPTPTRRVTPRPVVRPTPQPAKVAVASQPVEVVSARLDEKVADWLARWRETSPGEHSVAEEQQAAAAHFGRCSEMTVRRARKILNERANPTQESAR